MRHKRDQFSEDEINLMVIDLSGVPHGSKRWPALARRRLQPNLNRRFSGIVLFYRYLDLNTGAFIRTCDVEMHPNPYRNIPSRLLNELVSLNQAPATF